MNPEQTQNFVKEAFAFFGLEYSESSLQEIQYNGKKLYLKRDDQLELGCSKQRSIIPMIYHYLKSGKKKFVVSSSGNAGLVAAFCASRKKEDIDTMEILFSEGISINKLEKICLIFNKALAKAGYGIYRELNFHTLFTKQEAFVGDNLGLRLVKDPRQEAFNLGKEGFINLRGSTDDSALIGFETIAYELTSKLADKLTSKQIFIPASSGTTVQGIYEGFQKLNLTPKINVIQTGKVHTLIKNLIDKEKTLIEDTSRAESIVDIIGHRRNKIEEIIRKSNGNAYVISNEELENALKIFNFQLNKNKYPISYDSALTFAAWLRNQEDGAVLVFTG